MMESEGRHYRFDGIDVDLSNLRVTVKGEARPLEPKSFRLLQFLIENRGRAVPKDEMLAAVWTDTAVTDNALTRAVAQIRKALDDDPKEPRYVETVPTIGYRFLPEYETTSAVAETRAQGGRRTSRTWWAIAAAVGILLLGGGWLLARLTSVRRLPATAIATAQLTSSHGLDIDAAWSPDGSLVAYASDLSGRFEIYVRPGDATGRTLQLTSDGNQNLTPSFSADGRWVAYSSMAKPGIYRIPALGGSVQRLTDFGAQPKWSPDGQWIAFISNAKPSLSTTDYYYGANSSLWLVPAAGGAAKQLTSETFEGGQTFPSWSSDSREIRFVNYIGQTPSLWTYGMTGRKLEKRFEGPSGTTFGDAVFSRDSTRMYYVKSNLNGVIEIWMQALDPETLRPNSEAEPVLRPTLGVPRGLSLSQDGTRLAFTATLAESKLLMRKMTNGSFDEAPPEEITHETTYRYARPHWSPDGMSVIYTKFEKGQPARTLLDKLDGSPPRILGQGIVPEVYPLFAPDGKHVLVIAPGGGEKKSILREISVIDGAVRELASAADIAFPSLSPDGGAVAYHNPAEPFTHLYRLDLKTGARTQLTFGNQNAAFGSFSQDGKQITFSFNLRGRDELAAIPAEGGPAQVFWSEPGHWFSAGFIRSTDQVMVAGNRGGGWALYAIDVKAKTARQLSKELPLRMYLRYPEMSSDGKRIAYEFNESRGNVFVASLLR